MALSKFRAIPLLLFIGAISIAVNALSAPSKVSISANGVTGNSFVFSSGTPVDVRLDTTLPSPTIFYTLDGSTPTAASILYASPFRVSTNVTIRAIAYGPDFSSVEGGPVSISFVDGELLRLQTIGQGSVEKSPDKDTYAIGEQVTLRAIAAPYFKLLQWEDGSTNSNRTIVIAATNVYTAIFTNTVPLEEQVTFDWEITNSAFASNARRLAPALPNLDGFAVAGTVKTPDGTKYDLSQVSGNGEVTWRSSYGGKGISTLGAILPNSTNGFVLAGLSSAAAGTDDRTAPNLGKADVWLVGVARDGTKTFDKAFGTGADESNFAISPTLANDGFVLLIKSNTGLLFYRLSSNGDTLLQRAFPDLAANRTLVNVFALETGYLALAAIIDPNTGEIAQYSLIKFDTEGNFVAENSLQFSIAVTNFYIRRAFAVAKMLPDGRIACLWPGVVETFFDDGSLSWTRQVQGDGTAHVEFYGLAISDSGQLWLTGSGRASQGRGYISRIASLSADGEPLLNAFLSEIPAPRLNDFLDYPNITLGKDSIFLSTFDFSLKAAKLTRHFVPTGTPVVLINDSLPSNMPFTNRLSVEVKIESHLPDSTIYYTLDGSTNLAGAARYRGPFQLERTALLRAIALVPKKMAVFANALPVEIYPNFQLFTSPSPIGYLLPPNGSIFPSNSIAIVTAIGTAGAFIEWKGDLSGSTNPASILMDENKHVEAVFGALVYKSGIENGRIEIFPSIRIDTNGFVFYEFGSTVQVVAIPEPGYYFALWGKAATGTTNAFSLPITMGEQQVSALFSPLEAGKVALTAFANGRGQLEVMPSQKVYTRGDRVTLRATPAPRQTFLGWGVDADGNDPEIVIQLDDSMVIAANFSGANPLFLNHGVYLEMSPERYADKRRVTIYAPPGTPYRLQVSTNLNSWSDMRSGTATNGFVKLDIESSFSPRFFRITAQ